MHRSAWLALSVILCVGVRAAAETPPVAPPNGPLEAYLRRPHPTFAWAEKGREPLPGTDAVVHRLELTSQTWRGLPWTHRLNLIVPPAAEGARARPGHAVLAISGTGGEREHLALLGPLAVRLGVPVAVLHDVPNQPLFREDTPDGRGLREDALIAKTFVEFVKTGETDWPLLLPMTRAAVAALDALGEHSAAQGEGWAFGRLERFITTGASKRGWTTWLTAIGAPERVIGIAPIVYDNLNVKAQIARHLEVWGHPSPSIHDYTDRGLMQLLEHPRGTELMSFVDPYSYRARLDLPKMALMGTNDTYWPLDAVHLYKGDLPGDFFCHYVPNTGHSAGLSAVDAVAGFFDHVTGRTPPLPAVALTVSPRRGALVQVPDEARARVKGVRLWGAQVEAKDFTKASWDRVEARVNGRGWEADLPARCREAKAGSVAFIAEVELRDSGDRGFKVHSPVQVWELATPVD